MTDFSDSNDSIGNISDFRTQDYNDVYEGLDIGSYDIQRRSIIREVSDGPRNFKCPNCGGEFNSWKTKYKVQESYVDKGSFPGSTVGKPVKKFCPFCDMAQGEYNNEN